MICMGVFSHPQMWKKPADSEFNGYNTWINGDILIAMNGYNTYPLAIYSGLKMVIFYSYVSLPEGTYIYIYIIK